MELIGEYKPWSLWSTIQIKKWSFGLLHGFMFCMALNRHGSFSEHSDFLDWEFIVQLWPLFFWAAFMPFLHLPAGYSILGPTMSGRLSRTIYVGNLPLDIRESEVEDIFYKVHFLQIEPFSLVPWRGLLTNQAYLALGLVWLIKKFKLIEPEICWRLDL